LQKQGIDKWKLGREEFWKRSYAYCLDQATYAREQERRIGLTADWSREKFTLDPKLTEVVYDTFYKMLEDKLVFRGKYIINQCTFCRTALANVDTEHIEKEGIFAYIKYPVVGSKGTYLTVATTRPETMLGDTAVAVNPKDKRYQKLVGKEVELPLTGRTIPVIADEAVDLEVGTAALKITPAHSAIDFKIGKKHSLAVVNVIDERGRMTEDAPAKYVGMTVKDARDAVLADLKEAGLLEKVENITHEVIVCERCHHEIEQIMSNQWFVNVKPLAEKAIKILDEGKTKVLPASQGKVLRQWFVNIEPWCVSRQLWWGHRIPVWYCGSKALYDWLVDHPGTKPADYEKATGQKANGCGQIIPGVNNPRKCPKCAGAKIEQETDLFDTWFSSGQWPFSTLGGPGAEDFNKYYPGDVMETMRDIIFFWVARMMMMGLYRTGKTPFHTVYLHGMILAADGTKMSKSKGNGVWPDEVFKQYGADAVRLWYYSDTLPGQNTPVRHEKLKGNRNFVNKIWNASRYILMNLEGRELVFEPSLNDADRWIYERLGAAAAAVAEAMAAYRFNDAASTLYEYFWNDFCDWYLEATKLSTRAEDPAERDRAVTVLLDVLAESLALLHPFLPFVTEEIYGKLPNARGRLIVRAYPRPELRRDDAIAARFGMMKELVTMVRALRAEFGIAPEKKLRVRFKLDEGTDDGGFMARNAALAELLAAAEGVAPVGAKPEGALALAGRGFECYVYAKEAVDAAQLAARFRKDAEKERQFADKVEAKLASQGFVAGAPEEVVAKERQKLAEARARAEKLERYLADLA